MPVSDPEPVFFETPAEFTAWFARHHDRCTEVWVGLHRKDSGLPSITYGEAVEEALCWGWIDGLKRRYDETSYVQRFTPRQARSMWSQKNIATIAALERAGRMQPAGRAALARRDPTLTGAYSFEQDKPPELVASRQRAFAAKSGAWRFFNAQPPGYRRTALHWVESAKQEATRERRFGQLLACSERRERLPQLSGNGTKPRP
ncbi:YdeI/OmpD-associated family protein [Synoicihabitans lomoniglobus]|uniref:YdeI/OmpD-associated family protein n=1 Tax=Synoicihabitans lomoniglobus TaxID=2909285 RepID=A0AAF0CRQ8_9BACT|nr:YdeI/OmpD-associated family protein [Opitutaceae bacterium LMO-M01]WED66799.1 YdeI/OmpD-associated family protein [Opitutaceae bacterium LMO-M01]